MKVLIFVVFLMLADGQGITINDNDRTIEDCLVTMKKAVTYLNDHYAPKKPVIAANCITRWSDKSDIQD